MTLDPMSPPRPLDPKACPPIRTLQLAHPDGLRLQLMDLGATWLSCEVPLGPGRWREVLLGCQHPADYLRQSAYLGATIGRFSNRIAEARLRTAQGDIALRPNPGSRHQLHGGPDGFDRRLWGVASHGPLHAEFSLRSPHGDQGFPGELHARVRYELIDALSLRIHLWAQVSAPCPVSLTNHAYFNLDAQPGDVRQHTLRLAAQHYLPVDAELIPLGELAPVAGTGFDFRQPKTLQQDWLRDPQQKHGCGYDHAFLLDPARGPHDAVAQLSSAQGDLQLALHTSLPSLQLYAGQFLAGTPNRQGQPYADCSGVALEPQFLPNGMHHPQWPQPSCWLQPGETFSHHIDYRFQPG